ncbi:hypothetical protein lerEdw1_001125 [Lerista edwardsae]|nr:hypothetical protein lerEdw1_001125 [Lerista edwardsae]
MRNSAEKHFLFLFSWPQERLLREACLAADTLHACLTELLEARETLSLDFLPLASGKPTQVPFTAACLCSCRSFPHFSPKRAQPSALKMTEVQIDSSQLPPVQDVCRDFAVLEDGALAYCLQEQEIEQHYASNIQKNQLVQRDIRIAKKLQDVEEEESRLQASEEQKQM